MRGVTACRHGNDEEEGESLVCMRLSILTIVFKSRTFTSIREGSLLVFLPEADDGSEVFGIGGELGFGRVKGADDAIEVEGIGAVEFVSEEGCHLVKGDWGGRDYKAELAIGSEAHAIANVLVGGFGPDGRVELTTAD